MISAPVLQATDWRIVFRGHLDASQTAVGGTLIQLADDGNEHPIAFFLKSFQMRSATIRKTNDNCLDFYLFLKGFDIKLKAPSLRSLLKIKFSDAFSKVMLSRKEARWLETFGNFGIFPITLKPGHIYVLEDAPLRAPYILSDDYHVNSSQVNLSVDCDIICAGYISDQFLGIIVKAVDADQWRKRQL